MKDATEKFDTVLANTADDSLAQNVPDVFLDPVTLSFTEPDYGRLDKPSRWEREEVVGRWWQTVKERR